MPHTHRDRDKLKSRLKRIRGQLDAVERSLDREDNCGQVLQQIAAIRGAVAGPACGESPALRAGESSTARLTQQQDQDDEGNRNAD